MRIADCGFPAGVGIDMKWFRHKSEPPRDSAVPAVESSTAAPGVPRVWYVATAALAAFGVAASLALRRRCLQPAILAGDADALHRACLGFPWPILLEGTHVRRFADPDTAALTVSYSVSAARAAAEVHEYYAGYLGECGFVATPQKEGLTVPRSAADPAPAGLAAAGQSEAVQAPEAPGRRHPSQRGTVTYVHTDGLRTASVTVLTEPVRGTYHTVVVSSRPVEVLRC